SSGFAYIRVETDPSVCAAIACDPVAGPIIGYTGQVAGRVGTPESLRVVPVDPANPPLIAGTQFAMKVELLDANGQVASNYNGTLNVNQINLNSLAGESASPFGYSAVKPQPAAISIANGVGF